MDEEQTPPDPPASSINVGDAAKIVLSLASDAPELAEAGRSAARSVLTVTNAVENVLLPLAAVNFAVVKAQNYFKQKFPEDIAEVTRDVPPDGVVEPKASVAAPALQGLAFSHEEPDLKAMYLNLLRTAMDARTTATAHPAYVDIIRQMTAIEAQWFKAIIEAGSHLPIANLVKREGKLRTLLLPDLLDSLDQDGEPVVVPALPEAIGNWQRLGLMTVTYDQALPISYDWVKIRPEYVKQITTHVNPVVENGIIRLSPFGRSFVAAVM